MPDGYPHSRPEAFDEAASSRLVGDLPQAADLQEILAGLGQPQKTLPAKLFYDADGCRLFGAITRLPEYYLTRTELALLGRIEPELAIVPGCVFVEYGASDEAKAVAIFDAVGAASYVPIDVAADALEELTVRLAESRPDIAVFPMEADFLRPLWLPAAVRHQTAFGFFPGSTIGNLTPDTAVAFLEQARETLGLGASLLVGVDLQKPLDILLPAYNDAQGVTAAFNRNILSHINREHGADFDPAHFEHEAIWNAEQGRIEMHLRSLRQQTVNVSGERFEFRHGETIHTENSYKHTVAGFQALAVRAGWQSAQVWTDCNQLYSMHLLSSLSGSRGTA